LIARLRAIGWSLAIGGGGFLASFLLVRLLQSTAFRSTSWTVLSLAALQTAVSLGVFATLSWVAARRLRIGARDLGLAPVRGGLAGFGRGLLVGAALSGGSLVLVAAAGGAAWRVGGGSLSGWLGAAGLLGALLLPAALAEELAFRGVPMVAVSRAVGRRPAVLVQALLFGLAHAFNPGLTPLGIGNIVLAGVFLGLVFLSPGGLWSSTGAHLGWNLTLATLGASVSGLPFPVPGLSYVPGHPRWLTGGTFGPEGGLVATLCLVLGSAAVSQSVRKERPA
jgi:CAAX protease family protein